MIDFLILFYQSFQKEPDMDDWYESDNQRELRQIFQGQNQIYEVVKELGRKIDAVVGRQERTLSLISQQASGVVQTPPVSQGGAAGGGVPLIDTINRHEVDMMFNNQNQMVNLLKEMR